MNLGSLIKPSAPITFRAFGVLAALFAISSLFLDEQSVILRDPVRVLHNRGYMFMEIGWIEIFAFDISWYANLFLLSELVAMLSGQRPNKIRSILGLGIALTGFIPKPQYLLTDGVPWAFNWGPAIWVWIMAFAVILYASRIGEVKIAES